MKTKLILTGFAMMLSSALMSGQQGSGKGSCNGNGSRSGYVDANKNNICDKSENRSANSNSQKANNNSTQGKGKCVNYTDANKNGVCDHAEKQPAK